MKREDVLELAALPFERAPTECDGSMDTGMRVRRLPTGTSREIHEVAAPGSAHDLVLMPLQAEASTSRRLPSLGRRAVRAAFKRLVQR